VRNLEREIGNICRKVAREVLATGNRDMYRIAAKSVPKYLGVPKYRPDKAGDKDVVGMTNGLAFTSFGGAILQCEVAVVPGKGDVLITGLLEKGMQESAQAAMSYIRSRQKLLGLPEDFYQKNDYHIHFPEFIPKDGPSAGITIANSIASALMRIPVRRTVAMTGEITLRGRVLPIGGLKEKMLAAHRAGITTVLIEHMDEVLREALCLSDPDAIFGKRVPPVQYINGELVDVSQVHSEPSVPAPTVDPPAVQQ
jgi:ATP-dependent Lon protease